MDKGGVETLFEAFLRRDSLFLDKRALQTSYIPDKILYREEQQKQLATILAPTLKNNKPSNVFIYGMTGTGKTLTVKHTVQKLLDIAATHETKLKSIYLNCKLRRSADTEYRLIHQLAIGLGADRRNIPSTGIPTEEIYYLFLKILRKINYNYIFILDEIDQLIEKTGDNALYNLTRINEETDQHISLIGISNNIKFVDTLDPRVKSSLSEESINFPPYNALQIQSILRQRAELAFKDGCIEQGVIEKCSAYAARDHGDARRALELLRVAGEVADRKSSKKVMIEHIDEAEEKIDRDRILDIITTQPKQYQLLLFSMLSLTPNRNNSLFTGEIYEVYKILCKKTNTGALTQRRVSDIISEFDMLGIVNAKIISKGRYGRTRDISVEIPEAMLPKVKKILEDSIKA